MESEAIALAGLLHDIGKFMLRASVGGRYTWEKQAQGDFGYKHAMLSATFVEEIVPAQWRVQIIGPVGYHHRPQSRADRIVQLADHLSSAERDDGTQDAQPRTEHPKQLLSIFSRLKTEDYEPGDTERRYLPLRPLALTEETIFPAEAWNEPEQIWRAYESLWQGFYTEATALKKVHEDGGDLITYLESMLLLIQRYTWCIPAAYYKNVPDISLYDHSRMTAALAAVLDRAEVDEAWLSEARDAAEKNNQQIAMLIGGDISGVQDFIYTITARGATPSLRGRSFYLQMLTEAMARYILRRLDLPITNLIYAGGGNFYLLGRPDDKIKLTQIQQEISRVLLQQHRGSLYVAVAAHPLNGRDFFEGQLSEAWGQLHGQLQDAKQRRFSELGPDDLATLFKPLDHGGNEEKQCSVCGLEHQGTIDKRIDGNDESQRKCPPCSAFENLGKELRKARWLLLREEPLSPLPVDLDLDTAPGTWSDTLAALGFAVSLFEDPPKAENGAKRQILLALDDDARAALEPTAKVAIGRRLLVNTTPLLTGDQRRELLESATFPEADKHELPKGEDPVKPFGVLEYQSRGINRLGVLRMDVDNLGALFQSGLGKKATLARMAMLSFAVSLYFEGWVSRLAEEINQRDQASGFPPQQRLYAIYSGGDDLFFVGSWDAVVELAIAVRRDLTRYAAGHPGIHASAGIALVGGKYPLYQAARDAGAAEERAKLLRWWDGARWQRKDAICFLDEALPWRQFGAEAEEATPNYATVHGLMHELDRLLALGVPTALVRRLIQFYVEYRYARNAHRITQSESDWTSGPQTVWGRWMWQTVYTLKRLEARSKDELKPDLDRLRQQMVTSNYRLIEPLGVAARWAELIQRER